MMILLLFANLQHTTSPPLSTHERSLKRIENSGQIAGIIFAVGKSQAGAKDAHEVLG